VPARLSGNTNSPVQLHRLIPPPILGLTLKPGARLAKCARARMTTRRPLEKNPVVVAKIRSKLKMALFKVLLLNFSILLACLAAAIVLRFTQPIAAKQLQPQVKETKAAHDRENNRPVDDYHMTPNPSGADIEAPALSNSLGVCNPEIDPKTTDTHRIVVEFDETGQLVLTNSVDQKKFVCQRVESA